MFADERGGLIELPDRMTLGEAYGPAMNVTTRAEAREYFEALVVRTMRINGSSREEAERIERSNVGYWTGYYDSETRSRCHEMYGFGHPIFGAEEPSIEEALAAGAAMAVARGKAKIGA